MALTTVRPQGMGFNTGRRNTVINGAMQVAQRGTSTTGSSSNNVFPACDRWKVGFTSGGTYDFSQSTDAPDGFSNSIKVKCASTDTSIASGDEFVVQHRIEAQNLQQLAYGTSAAKDITLSFYAKAVNKTGTYCVHIQKNDSTAAYIYKEYTLTTSWQRFELTFPANAVVQASGGAIANDNGIGLIIMFILMNGSSTQGTDAKDQWSTTNHRSSSSQVNFMDSTSNEWYVTGVQLELGSNASDFEHRSFAEELTLCLRYYYAIADGSASVMSVGNSSYYNNTYINGITPLPVLMRAKPSIEQTTGTNYFKIIAGGASDTFNGFDGLGNTTTLHQAELYASSNLSGTQGHGGIVSSDSSSARLAFSAEL